MDHSTKSRPASGDTDIVAADVSDTSAPIDDGTLANVQGTTSSRAQIVFIDGSDPDAQALAQGVDAGVTAIILSPDSDGVQQIADWLTSHDVRGAGAIDIVAHGTNGELRLGNALLTATTIGEYSSALSQIGNALQPGGSIQLYSCDIAQDAAGTLFLQQLSQATGGADIAASSHLVGSAAGGGSWDLDVDVGTVDVGSPFTQSAIGNFTSELSLTSDQLFFNASNGLDTSPANSGNRVEQISVNGTNAASNPINLASGSSDVNALEFLRGISIDAPLNEFFVANGTPTASYTYYGLFRGITNPGGPGQSLTEIYAAPGPTGTIVGQLFGVALDQPNGKVYFSQAGFDTSYGTFVPAQSGIFEVGINGGTAIHVVSTPDTLKPVNLALDTKDNLVFFTAFSVDPNNGSSETGVVVEAANLSTGTIQQLTSFASTDMFPGGIAVNTANSTVYFTTDNPQNISSTENGIFDATFTVTGTGSSAAISHFGSVSTLYSGTHANVPGDIAIDPADGVFFISGETPVATASPNSESGDTAAIWAGSLTNSSPTANLTQIFNVTSILSVGTGTNTGPAFDSTAEGLVFDSTPTVSAIGTVTYAQGGNAVALAPSLTVSNQDGQNLKTATVAITSGFLTGDTLTASTAATNIGASFSNGTLTLTGTATNGGDTLANFQSVLDSVKFSHTGDPTNGGSDNSRTISWTISDGIIASTTPTTTVTTSALCFCAGTLIRTPDGDVPVEQLAVRDKVVTWCGRTRRIIWIGYRRIDCSRHPQPKRVWPVRISAGAFGSTQPQRDLLLSPDHAVYFMDVLIPVKHLINGSSIVQVPMAEIAYYHIELPEHDVILAENLPAESYLDTGDRSNFADAHDPPRLFPDFSTRPTDPGMAWESRACAPLIIAGVRLEAARRQLEIIMGTEAVRAA